MKLILMRHGQTDFNKEGRFQGRIDIPLNAEGISQAEKVADEIRQQFGEIDLIFSSPLERAKHTASIVGKSESLIIDQRIIEISFGPYEGEKGFEAKGMYHFFKYPHTHGNLEGVESYDNIIARTVDFLVDVASDSDLHKKTILVSTHGAILHAMLYYVDNLELSDFWTQDIGNCGYFVAELDRGKLKRIFADFKEKDRILVFKKDASLNK